MIRLGTIRFLVLPGLLIAGLWGCSSSPPSGSSTPVRLTVELPSSPKADRQSAAAVPSGVALIRLDVSAGDMGTVTDLFNVSPGETVTRTVDIPSGPGRIFTVTAFDSPDSGGTALYQGISDAVDLAPGVPTPVMISMKALLVSIAVTPFNPSIPVNAAQQLVATGTYADGSRSELTATAAWSSSDTNVAVINSSGLATGMVIGSTVISAASGTKSGSMTLSVTAKITRLSLLQGVIGDSVKITGYGFGAIQGSSNAIIGGLVATPIFRWSDTEIIAEIPSSLSSSPIGVATPVLVSVAGQNSNALWFLLLNQLNGIGGENSNGNLDKLVIPSASATVTVIDLSTGGGVTNSIALSGDATTAIEADTGTNLYSGSERVRALNTGSPLPDDPLSIIPTSPYSARDAAISQDGTAVLLTHGSPTLTLLTGFNSTTIVQTSITNPNDPSGLICLLEVALNSNGNTAAVIGEDGYCDGGAYHVYRIDNLLSSPVFTPVSDAGLNAVYTDIAISEDGNTVVAGRVEYNATPPSLAGMHRIRNFATASPQIETDLVNLYSTIQASTLNVDVDLSADGYTGIAGVTESYVLCGVACFPITIGDAFQILNADAVSSTAALILGPTSSVIDGAAVSSGGSIALVKDGASNLTRFDGFNQSSPIATLLSAVPNLNAGAGRSQDQIDLQ
jgi:hypothetical protein